MTEEMTMTVSPVCTRKGEKVAYVSFTGSGRNAEGIIPDCKIISHDGFSEEEVGQLELYLKMNLGELKKRAASVNAVRAMMQDKPGQDETLRSE